MMRMPLLASEGGVEKAHLDQFPALCAALHR